MNPTYTQVLKELVEKLNLLGLKHYMKGKADKLVVNLDRKASLYFKRGLSMLDVVKQTMVHKYI
jgi:hypothetical protein